MRLYGSFGPLVLAIAVVALTGCSGDKKSDGGGPAPADPKDKVPEGSEGGPDGVTPAPGEPKFKVESEQFIKEYTTNGRAASAKYSGSVVEVKGPVARSAALETDERGALVGEAGAYKAVLVIGDPDAKRFETVVVRGLKPTVVGTIFQGQQVRVKGRVARYQETNPIALADAEVVSPGADPSIPLQSARFFGGGEEDYKAKFKTAPARINGTVVKRGTDVTDYVEVQLDNGDRKIRCYLLEGTEPLYPSGFEPGMKVPFVGMLRDDVIDKGSSPTDVRTYVLRDAVPLHRDPKVRLGP
jgi:hypothetical protein